MPVVRIKTIDQYFDLLGASPTKVFRIHVYEFLHSQCELSDSVLDSFKRFLCRKGVVKEQELRQLNTSSDVLNCFTTRLLVPESREKLISDFLKYLCFENVLSLAVTKELKDLIEEGVKTELHTNPELNNNSEFIFGSVFSRNCQIQEIPRRSSGIEERLLIESPEPSSTDSPTPTALNHKTILSSRTCIIMGIVVVLLGFLSVVIVVSTKGAEANGTVLIAGSGPSDDVNVDSPSSQGTVLIDDNVNATSNGTGTIIPMSRTTTIINPNTANLTYNFTNIFDNPVGFVSLITDLESVRYSQAMICRDKIHTTLNISLTRRVDIMNFHPNCSEKVKGLDIAGPVSTNELIVLMQRFPNIEFLSFSGNQICEEMEDNSSEIIVIQGVIPMVKLTHLKFENVSECPELYKFIWQTVSSPNLTKLVFANVFVNSVNQELIENIVTKNERIESLSFKGSLCEECQPFKKVRSWPRLKYLEIEVTNPSGSKAIEFYKVALNSTTNLLYLKSNIKLQEEHVELFKNSRLSLVYVDVAVKLNDSRVQFTLRHFGRFVNLRQLHLTLISSNRSVCRVNGIRVTLTHLRELVERLPNIDEISLTSNCDIFSDWRLPCREFEYGRNEALEMRFIKAVREINCTSGTG